jgi:two-component system sensor kinase FixL
VPYLDSIATPGRLTAVFRALDAVEHDSVSPEAAKSLIAEARRELMGFEQAFRERDRHLAALWACNPQLHWIADEDDNLLWVSRSWTELTGSPVSEALRAGWREFVHPDDADAYIGAAHEAINSGRSYDLRFRGRTPEGSYRWLRTRGVPHCEGQGRATFLYGFTEDIHDQVVAEMALARAAERSALAGLATNDLIYDLDVATGAMQWNDAIREFCEEPGMATLSWWEECLHPADRAAAVDSLAAFLGPSDEQRWQAEYRLRRLDGTYASIYERGYALRHEDRTARRMIGAMTDLTARVEADARIKQLQSELIHVSRLSAMGAMAATLAHELNQPLAAASNWIGVARVHAQKTPETYAQTGSALDEARASITRAGEIIRRIRSMLWRGKNNREVHDVRDIVDESLRLALIGATTSGIACRLVVHSIEVLVDRVQIEQVLLNLVRNAIEAMADQARRELVITAQTKGEFVEVTVSDTGLGLDMELQARLFTPFVTTKEQGLGVGLSISRTIIEEHGGSIRAIANHDGGATFVFTLPRARRLATAATV